MSLNKNSEKLRVIKAISLHDFKNQEMLGEGCFGQIYRAQWIPGKEKCIQADKEKEIKEGKEVKDEEVKDVKELKDEEVKDVKEDVKELKDEEVKDVKEDVKELKDEEVKDVKEHNEEDAKDVKEEKEAKVEEESTVKEEEAVEVAIKVLKNASSQEVLAERDRLSIPDHENVVKLLGTVYLWKGTTIAPWLVMENLPLGNLRKYILSQRNTGGISANGMMKIAWGIARGMEYLHSNGIIHGDLATRNCILGDKLNVKIGDLGYYDDKNARYYHDYKQSNVICPVRWMAPENLPYRANRAGNMVPCRPRHSFAGDVWAYGVVLYELWSRAKDPFHKLSDNYDVCDALLQSVTPTHFQRLKVRRHIWNLMHHCWEFMPSVRPKAHDIVDHFEVNEANVWLMANDYISI